jgi:hypothetical protein
MRLSGLVVAVLFALTSFAFAQHSSAGSSGGSSSSFSSGSASHGGTSGGSSSASYSSSGRSSGGSGSHGSAAQTTRSSGSQNGLNVRLAQAGATSSRTQAEKRGFFSTLRHPFRKPTPMVEADWRRPVCKKQPCVVAPRPSLCPPGQPLNGKGVLGQQRCLPHLPGRQQRGAQHFLCLPVGRLPQPAFDSESTRFGLG